MLKVLVVGDKPSSKNISQYVPFVGTKSYTRLKEWLKVIDPNKEYSFHITNSYRQSELDYIEYWTGPIIVLGKTAEKRVIQLNKAYGLLPHPSFLNRKCNDKEYITNELFKIKKMLEGYNAKIRTH